MPPIVPYLCREEFFEPTTSHLAAYVIRTLTLTMLTKGVGSYLHLPYHRSPDGIGGAMNNQG